MRNRLSERIHPMELIEARAAIEAKPLPAPPAPKPPNWGRNMLSYLRALDVAAEPNIAPIAQTDWSARLADDWKHVESNLDDLGVGIVREASRTAARNQYSVHVLAAPLLSELAELKAVTIVNWRQALRVHAEAELALYAAELKAQVA